MRFNADYGLDRLKEIASFIPVSSEYRKDRPSLYPAHGETTKFPSKPGRYQIPGPDYISHAYNGKYFDLDLSNLKGRWQYDFMQNKWLWVPEEQIPPISKPLEHYDHWHVADKGDHIGQTEDGAKVYIRPTSKGAFWWTLREGTDAVGHWNMYPEQDERTEVDFTLQSRIDDLENESLGNALGWEKANEELENLKRFPVSDEEFPEKAVITFTKRFEDSPKTYTYAAIKVNGLWYTTGRDGYTHRGESGLPWTELVDFMKDSEEVWHADEWERVVG